MTSNNERKSGREAPSTCRDCACLIWWDCTANNKWIPVDFDGEVHFATCVASRKSKVVEIS